MKTTQGIATAEEVVSAIASANFWSNQAVDLIDKAKNYLGKNGNEVYIRDVINFLNDVNSKDILALDVSDDYYASIVSTALDEIKKSSVNCRGEFVISGTIDILGELPKVVFFKQQIAKQEPFNKKYFDRYGGRK